MCHRKFIFIDPLNSILEKIILNLICNFEIPKFENIYLSFRIYQYTFETNVSFKFTDTDLYSELILLIILSMKNQHFD